MESIINKIQTFLKNIKKIIPIGRMAKKNEYNDLILFLCSKASSYMTGSVIVSDGGRTPYERLFIAFYNLKKTYNKLPI